MGDDQSDDLHSAKQVGYDIYVRAGLVEYLLERNDRAVAFFEKAKPLQPAQTYVVAHGKIPTGIERLIEAAKSGKTLTPEIVRQGDEQAKLILMLADIYFQGREFTKSWELCNRLIYSEAIARATREQRSYAHYKRARSCYCLHGKARKPDAALADYVVAVRAAPRAPWASTAMFLAANILWNHKHNPDAAVSIWNRLIRSYPGSKEADASTLFISVVYRWTNRADDARKVLTDFLAKHPESPLADGARKQLAKLDSPPHGKGDQTPRQGDDAKTGRQQQNQ